MSLYELDGATEAIERSRQALAKGQMRLSLANVECLGFFRWYEKKTRHFFVGGRWNSEQTTGG